MEFETIRFWRYFLKILGINFWWLCITEEDTKSAAGKKTTTDRPTASGPQIPTTSLQTTAVTSLTQTDSASGTASTATIPRTTDACPITTTAGTMSVSEPSATSTTMPFTTQAFFGGANPVSTTCISDTRVSWVYDLKKPQLIEHLLNRNLDTSGRSADLRARLVASIRSAVSTPDKEQPPLRPVFDPYCQSTENSHPTGTIPKTTSKFRSNADELGIVREMLGLVPNADHLTLKERLHSLLQQERILAHETYLHSRPSEDISSYLPGNATESVRTPLPRPMYTTTDRFEPERTRTQQPDSHSIDRFALSAPRQPEEYQVNQLPNPAARCFEELGSTQQPAPRYDSNAQADTATLCNLVRKWNLRFEDKMDPISFMERLNELIESYEIPANRILRALPEIFKGNALLWWRNNKDMWRNFNDFHKDFELQYLPPGYYRSLDREIQERTQGEHETCRSFVVALSTLLRRRGGFTETSKLERIYSNLKPDYKFYIRRTELRTVSDLVARAEEYEALLREKSTYRPPPGPAQALTPETAYQARSRKRVEFSKPVFLDELHQPRQKTTLMNNQRESTSTGQKFSYLPTTPANRTRFPSPHPILPDRPEPRKSQPSHNGRSLPTEPKPPLLCFNCEQEGHIARYCPQPRRVRCFYCKKDGKLTIHCDCRSENCYPTQRKGSLESRRTN